MPVQSPTSLEKAIAILTSLSKASHPMSLAELSRSTGLPKTTAYRLLGTLCRNGLAQRIGIDYAVGDHLLTLAGHGRRPFPAARRIVLPHLVRLYELTRHTVNLAVARGLEAAYVERVYGQSRIDSPSDDIDRAPLHCTATGKVLLAFDQELGQSFRRHGSRTRMTRHTLVTDTALDRELHRVRRQGVAYAREELAKGIACAAAPVFGPDGRICMSIGVAGPAGTLHLPELAAVVRRTANALSSAVGKHAARQPTPHLTPAPRLL
ncbi:IclR family transcriptional regulator [Sinosporangium album]|uniref:IclR family transcriptional regulator n=1 Tax=Sinosporangium album TaxID=504805 RepID=UPI0015A4D49A|nr:IclR family transcriptional regulator [Sinosporangium album]